MLIGQLGWEKTDLIRGLKHMVAMLVLLQYWSFLKRILLYRILFGFNTRVFCQEFKPFCKCGLLLWWVRKDMVN